MVSEATPYAGCALHVPCLPPMLACGPCGVCTSWVGSFCPIEGIRNTSSLCESLQPMRATWKYEKLLVAYDISLHTHYNFTRLSLHQGFPLKCMNDHAYDIYNYYLYSHNYYIIFQK